MLSNDFLAGYISAHGSFMNVKVRDKTYPVFQIKSSIANYPLLLKIANSLGALNCVHKYTHSKQQYSILLIRDRETILKNLIPMLDDAIEGEKKIMFDLWKQDFLKNSSTWNYRQIKGTRCIKAEN